ncbi:TynA Cu2+-containing amine oxidase [Pyrenophora tritici-repentis]|uniref:Amine oxidase n=1 Tax=Pyrenophora tritici-repentis TaxID=45151 RepID=A0A2W1HXY4_9PLEO|nr:Amine oxidase [Pyrenophora tritici-repentis]KAF7452154.1 Amine oxidase [Pyrenophora tritici-repentis]KAF7574728.1 TynA, Cu2+-containing amine oxidase [Pyrenophora tritici-repentis]KAG9386500.1 Amine oxidase [Pyrenophora tritici-repentis]KAI0586931.1 Amine oxidase [Pyrenophora tritici-repentis]
MKCYTSLTLCFAAIGSFAAAKNSSTSAHQPTVSAPHANPWKALSKAEVASVNEILQESMFLTGNQGSSHDSYIVQISLLHPNKTDVLPFLHGNSSAPGRYARATVQIGATNSSDGYWQEYMVGPLTAADPSTVEPLTYPFQNSEPGKTVMDTAESNNEFGMFITRFAEEHDDIWQRLFNSSFMDGLVGLRLGAPNWDEDGRVIAWTSVFSDPGTNLSSVTVLPHGFSIKFDLTGRNWEDWKVMGWYSLGQFWETADEFRAVINAPDYQIMPPSAQDGDWSSTDQRGEPWPLDDLPPPQPVSQGPQRFRIDEEEQYATWMDFSFYHTVSHDIGLSLHNIQYKGKRIMYELSLQESLTAYAGSDPFASQANFFDTTTGMGSTLQPLVRGYDCPAHATYLPATWTQVNETMTQKDAICLFEHDTAYPIRRHSYAGSSPHTSVAKNIVFVMRTIATVANYDFMIDYSFAYDGAIEVNARASGFISAAYWDNQPEYGFHIHDFLSSSIHDHVLTFKADFDINGLSNSVQATKFVPTTTTYPWSQGRLHNTFKANRTFIADESEASLDWHDNDAVLFAIVNKDTPNRFGEYPGYRFKKNAGVNHLTQTNSTGTVNSAIYGNHHFYITQQKDTEPRAADPFNKFRTADPLVNFGTFLDGESLDQEDVVLWFNLGMHHMPHTGDLPNTMFSSAHSTMRFEPFNYLEGDPSVATNQQVRIDYDTSGNVEYVEEFGKMVANATTTCH